MQLLNDLFSGDRSFGWIAVLVACGIAALVVLAIVYRIAFAHRLRVPGGRTRQPRLGLVDAFSLDGQRQLVLIRRDNVEHLVMIGGPNDVLVESEISRAVAPARDNNFAPAQPAAPARQRADSAAVPAPAAAGQRAASAAPAAEPAAAAQPVRAAEVRPARVQAAPAAPVPVPAASTPVPAASTPAAAPAVQSAAAKASESARPTPAVRPPPRPSPPRPSMPPPIIPAGASRPNLARTTETPQAQTSPAAPTQQPAATNSAARPAEKPEAQTAQPEAAQDQNMAGPSPASISDARSPQPAPAKAPVALPLQSQAAKPEPQGAPAKGPTAPTAPSHAEKPETRAPAAKAPVAPPGSPAQTPQSAKAEVGSESRGEQDTAPGVAKPGEAPPVTSASEELFGGLDDLEEEMARLLGREKLK